MIHVLGAFFFLSNTPSSLPPLLLSPCLWGVPSDGPWPWSGTRSNVPVRNHFAADFAAQPLQLLRLHGVGHGHLPPGALRHFPVLPAAAAAAAAATATTTAAAATAASR